MTEETLELEAETKTEVATEVVKKEDVETSQEKTDELKKDEEALSKDSVEQEDLETEDDEFEWHEKPMTVKGATDETQTKTESNVDASQLATLKAENEALKAELATIKADPLVSTYSQYLSASDEPNLAEFLKQVGAISYDVTQGLQGEDLVRKRYEQDAIAAGLSGDDLNYAVEEELESYRSATTLNKKRLESEAKSALQGSNGAKSLEDLQKEFVQTRQAKTNADIKWLESNYTSTIDCLNKAIAKGVWNNRRIDSKWGERIKTALGKSNDIFLADFVRYTEPNKEGVSNLYAPDVIDYLDFALHRNEFKKLSKKKRDAAVASTLEEKAQAAHETSIASEKTSQKKEAADLQYFVAFEKERGKRHPDDPRNKS